MPLPGVLYVISPNRFINIDLMLRLISSETCGQPVPIQAIGIVPNRPFKSKPYPTLIAASTTILLYLIW